MKTRRGDRILLVIVIIAFLVPLASAESNVAEGRLYEFQSGESFSWTLTPGTYYLVVAAGDSGVSFDASSITPDHPEADSRILQPNAVTVGIFEADRAPRTLHILNGSGTVVVSRPDFGRHAPLGETTWKLDANGYLDAGACRAYHFSVLRMTKPYVVGANGTGITFALFDWYLDEIQRSGDTLLATLGTDKAEETGFLLQACNEGERVLPFAARITYPAPATTTKNAPAPDVALIVLGIAATMLLSRSRHRWT